MAQFIVSYLFLSLVAMDMSWVHAETPATAPVKIRGTNSLKGGESIKQIQEGHSLQLSCVVRDESLINISWTRNGNLLTHNLDLVGAAVDDQRYDIESESRPNGRRFFLLTITNITRLDSGTFTCASDNPDIYDSVSITVKFAPDHSYPICSVESRQYDVENGTRPVVMTCLAEIGEPPYHLEWYRDGQVISSENEETTEEQIISTLYFPEDDFDHVFECRLFLQSDEIPDRRCCFGVPAECTQIPIHPTPLAPTTRGSTTADIVSPEGTDSTSAEPSTPTLEDPTQLTTTDQETDTTRPSRPREDGDSGLDDILNQRTTVTHTSPRTSATAPTSNTIEVIDASNATVQSQTQDGRSPAADNEDDDHDDHDHDDAAPSPTPQDAGSSASGTSLSTHPEQAQEQNVTSFDDDVFGEHPNGDTATTMTTDPDHDETHENDVTPTQQDMDHGTSQSIPKSGNTEEPSRTDDVTDTDHSDVITGQPPNEVATTSESVALSCNIIAIGLMIAFQLFSFVTSFSSAF